MQFLNREAELGRLDALLERATGSFVVVYGRRRLGKTRLLVEWCRRHGGAYDVADQSASHIQRAYFAQAIAARLPGFGDVAYPDWRTLLTRLVREASAIGFRGPIVLDELPYLVQAAPELPSVLQRWVDHEAIPAGLVVAVAGSSQRMMDGIVLSESAPLYGRASELLKLEPLAPRWLESAFGAADIGTVVQLFAAWGGVPRYWELASATGSDLAEQVHRLVLDPMGPLHREPERLLLEEQPPATEVRPLLDAIGLGAHRVSEIGGRIGRPATALARPLARLSRLGLVRREVPWGEDERRSKRSLYRIADPFLRMWFRVVGPWRSLLAISERAERLALWRRYWPGLAAAAWEELVRAELPRGGEWGQLGRWWRGNAPEWDAVGRSRDGARLLLGEAKWSATPMPVDTVLKHARAVAARPEPTLAPAIRADRVIERALFVVAVDGPVPEHPHGVQVITGDDLLSRG